MFDNFINAATRKFLHYKDEFSPFLSVLHKEIIHCCLIAIIPSFVLTIVIAITVVLV